MDKENDLPELDDDDEEEEITYDDIFLELAKQQGMDEDAIAENRKIFEKLVTHFSRIDREILRFMSIYQQLGYPWTKDDMLWQLRRVYDPKLVLEQIEMSLQKLQDMDIIRDPKK